MPNFNKVTVMSPDAVAAMRRAKKEMEANYHSAKVGSLKMLLDEMRNTGREYLLSELSEISGLSTHELVAQLTAHGCKAASEAGLRCGEVCSSAVFSTRTFVEVRPDGSVNPDSTINVHRELATFYIPKSRR